MGNFLNHVIQSRNEWLKKPNIFPRLNYPYSSGKGLNTNPTSSPVPSPSPSPSPSPVLNLK